jgi:hypothetical protein
MRTRLAPATIFRVRSIFFHQFLVLVNELSRSTCDSERPEWLATLTVARLGCESIKNERFMADDPPRCLYACFAILLPDALHERWVSGRSGRLGVNARRRSTLETFASSASDPTFIDTICGRKFRLGEIRMRRREWAAPLRTERLVRPTYRESHLNGNWHDQRIE